MSLIININIETYESVSWKNVSCEIAGKPIIEYYSYETAISDNTIQAEVEQDLSNKGYIW